MCWGEDPEDYKDVYHEGVVNLFGACEIGDKGGKEEYTIGKVFGTNKQDLSWDEFIAKCPEDVFGICQKSKLLDKIQEIADKVIGEWLEAVGRSYHNQIEPLSTQVDCVTVSESRIDFNFRCDYKFYYEHTISRWTNEDSDWDEDDDILVNILNDAGWDKDCPDVWCEIYFNDRDFSFR